MSIKSLVERSNGINQPILLLSKHEVLKNDLNLSLLGLPLL